MELCTRCDTAIRNPDFEFCGECLDKLNAGTVADAIASLEQAFVSEPIICAKSLAEKHGSQKWANVATKLRKIGAQITELQLLTEQAHEAAR